MKKSYLSILVFGMGLLASCQQGEKKESTEVVAEEVIDKDGVVSGNFGELISEQELVNPSEMITLVVENGTFEGKILGEIKEVCVKKGCWLTMDLPNGESMRVTFKDYAFFVPTNSQGFPIILDGVATMTTTDVETLRHFAEDQGKTVEEVAAITEPKREITFEATGVIIKDKV
jgi:hypothetical protein